MGKVLVVDDDRVILELLEMKLGAAGLDVHTASDGEAGWNAAHTVEPDVIVMDWMMPGRSGLDVCRALRGKPRFADTPILMLTARAAESDAKESMANGATAIITKPFSPRDLVTKIRLVLPATDPATVGDRETPPAAPIRRSVDDPRADAHRSAPVRAQV